MSHVNAWKQTWKGTRVQTFKQHVSTKLTQTEKKRKEKNTHTHSHTHRHTHTHTLTHPSLTHPPPPPPFLPPPHSPLFYMLRTSIRPLSWTQALPPWETDMTNLLGSWNRPQLVRVAKGLWTAAAWLLGSTPEGGNGNSVMPFFLTCALNQFNPFAFTLAKSTQPSLPHPPSFSLSLTPALSSSFERNQMQDTSKT